MRIVLIEDEIPASEKLKLLLKRFDPTIEISAVLADVQAGIEWFERHQHAYDLVFSDILLTDGTSFDIFRNSTITAPVILITAYDEYALEAFRVNSIDYLLKPITYEALAMSMAKVDTLKNQLKDRSPDLEQLGRMLMNMKKKYKERFMVKTGDHIRSIKTLDILSFYADGRTVYLISNDLKKHIVDYKLEALEELLDPSEFFRVNRSVIISINAIQDVVVYSNSRLRIDPSFPYDREIIVSRDKVGALKTWLEGKPG